jgi:hypothetical protein
VSECLVVITTVVLGVAVFDLVSVVASEVRMSDLGHVGVMFNLEIAIPALRTDEGQDDDIGVDATQEDTDDFAVIVALRDLGFAILCADDRREREL